MAINTENKRASASGLPFWTILPAPNSVVGVLDRLQTTWLYCGIAGLVSMPGVPIFIPKSRAYFLGPEKHTYLYKAKDKKYHFEGKDG